MNSAPPGPMGALSFGQKAAAIGALLAFHALVAGALSLIAHSPYLSAYHNGQGLWYFARDSFTYHAIGAQLADEIGQGLYVGNQWVEGWLDSENQWHTRCIALLYHLFGPRPFALEIVNAPLWAGAVVLVYLAVRRLAGPGGKTAIVAAGLFGLMPSNLLLSTQLLKEPFYNLGMAVFFLGWTGLLAGERKTRYIALPALGALLSAATRGDAQPLFLIAAAIGALLAFGAGRAVAWRAVAAFVVTAAVLAIALPAMAGALDASKSSGQPNTNPVPVEKQKETTRELVKTLVGDAYTPSLDARVTRWLDAGPWYDFDERKRVLENLARVHGPRLEFFLDRFLTKWRYLDGVPDSIEQRVFQASLYRDSFLTYYLTPDANTVDRETLFRDVFDVARYVPRALQIGLFAPFPSQWLSRGGAGGPGARLAGGIEMMVWYALWAGFLWFLLRAPAGAAMKLWMIAFLVVFILPLGLFVPNIGALFRMRLACLLPVLAGGCAGWALAGNSLKPTRWRSVP